MPDLQKIDQQVHDLVDEANVLILSMALTGRKDEKTAHLIVRMRDCAEQAREAGRDKSARHLREVANMLEEESIENAP
jgi:hypothetical protein